MLRKRKMSYIKPSNKTQKAEKEWKKKRKKYQGY